MIEPRSEPIRLFHAVVFVQAERRMTFRIAQSVPPTPGFLLRIRDYLERLFSPLHLETLRSCFIRTTTNPWHSNYFHFRPVLYKSPAQKSRSNCDHAYRVRDGSMKALFDIHATRRTGLDPWSNDEYSRSAAHGIRPNRLASYCWTPEILLFAPRSKNSLNLLRTTGGIVARAGLREVRFQTQIEKTPVTDKSKLTQPIPGVPNLPRGPASAFIEPQSAACEDSPAFPDGHRSLPPIPASRPAWRGLGNRRSPRGHPAS